MRRIVAYIVFVVISLLEVHAQVPYALVGTKYVFQNDQNEINWIYKVGATVSNKYIDTSTLYAIKLTSSFYSKGNVHLFDIASNCTHAGTLSLFDSASNCYNDTVKMVFTISIWNNDEDQCSGDLIYECSSDTVLLENPLIYNKFQMCRTIAFDPFSCTVAEGDSLVVSYEIERYADLYINSYGLESFPANTKFVMPIGIFCMDDSVSINFRPNGQHFKLYKQYNDQLPQLVSAGDIEEELILSGQADSLCSYQYWNYYNDHTYKTVADTINDAGFADNEKYTRTTYYLCIQDECGQDSFYTISHAVYVYKPLRYIPYTLFHNCTTDRSGSIAFDMSDRFGGYMLNNFSATILCSNPNLPCEVSLCDSVTYNRADQFQYTLFKDNIFNNTYDELCYDIYKQGTLCASCDNDTIVGLMEGDYKIVISLSNEDCGYVYEDTILNYPALIGILQDEHPNISINCCIKKSSCTGEAIEFTFTIKKFNYEKPLGPDRILCEDSTVILNIPSSLVIGDGSNINWGTAYCGSNSAMEGFPYLRSVENGGGGYHTVTIHTDDGCLIKDTAIVADLKPVTKNYMLPTALATNAVQQSSGWSTQFATIQWEDAEMMNYFAESNIYFNGSAGIFRPQRSHDYNDTLNSSSNLFKAAYSEMPASQLGDITIRNTGNIIDYKLFNYSNPLFSDCVPQWVLNNTMTKYSPSGYDIENKDILNIHSAALYGYKDKLPIAVCSNAQVDEIGFESFEEYSDNSEDDNYFNAKTQLNNSTGNIDIVRQTESLFMPKMKDYDVVRAFNRYAMIKGNICSTCDKPFKCNVFAQSVPYDYATEKITDMSVVSYETNVMASPCGDSSYTILQLDENLPSGQMAFRCNFWAGKISVLSKRFVPLLGTYSVELDNTIAHTGNYSLKLPADQRVILPQVDLELQPRKSYFIGAWMHRAAMLDESVESLRYTNASDSIGILVILPNNEKIFLVPSGEVINGWQRLEGNFTMPAGMRTEIKLGFVGKKQVNIDDIRIYPKNSAIQTYIYDQNNYKVRAVLDQNNYATMYGYDDEGNLFSLKKETVKGIKTIQVSNSYLKSNK